MKVEVPKWRLSRALNQDLQQFTGVRFDGLTNPNLRQLATERANSVRFLRPVEVVSQNTTLPVSFSTNYRFGKGRGSFGPVTSLKI